MASGAPRLTGMDQDSSTLFTVSWAVMGDFLPLCSFPGVCPEPPIPPLNIICRCRSVMREISVLPSLQVKEPLLVKDVLYACQGVNGKFTSFQQVRLIHHGPPGGHGPPS